MAPELRQRRKDVALSPTEPVEKAGPSRPRLDEVEACLRLANFQILFGLLYATALLLTLKLEHLAPWHDVALWFVSVQHKTSWGRAHAGCRDFGIVVSGFVTVIFTRAVSQHIIIWLARGRSDLSPKAKVRLTEQGWSLLYYGTSATVGLYLLKQQSYGWNAVTLWHDFPHYYIDPNLKAYYLVVLGFWLSQLFIIHLEDHRKDHYQMFVHHIVTCLLVSGSFAYSYTRLGHLVIIMMDFVDTWLAIAKCTKYLKIASWITDGCFLIFLITWVLLRHILYMYEIMYGAFPALDDLEGSCVYDLANDSLYAAPVQCFSKKVHFTFFALTIILQGITLMWLVMILNVVVRVINGYGAEDTRSDSEDN